MTMDDMTRADMLARLRHWNDRLMGLNAEPLVANYEAEEMTDRQLARVLNATLDHLVDILQAARH